MIPIIKIAGLILYAILVYVGITRQMTLEANVSIGLLAVLGIVHLVECVIFRRLISEAPGGVAWNAVNVFLFGVVHAGQMKKAMQAGNEPAEGAGGEVA